MRFSQVRDRLARLQKGTLRLIGPLLACLALIVVGGLAFLAHSGPTSSRSQGNGTMPGASTTYELSPTPSATATTDGATIPPPLASPTSGPTPVPYTGPNYVTVIYDLSSCHPGAVSPYPYLDLNNSSPSTILTWDIWIGNPAYVLYKNPPMQIPSGYGDFLAFIGPMQASAPLDVTISANIGSWSGALEPCSVATPTPPSTPTPPPSPPTPTPLPAPTPTLIPTPSPTSP